MKRFDIFQNVRLSHQPDNTRNHDDRLCVMLRLGLVDRAHITTAAQVSGISEDRVVEALLLPCLITLANTGHDVAKTVRQLDCEVDRGQPG